MHMTKKKKILIAVGISFLLLLLFGIFSFFIISKVTEGNQILAETIFTAVDISSIADGEYIGDFESGMVYAKVEVVVSDGIMTDIKILEHVNGMGSSGESITDTMLTEQTTDVDTASGATISSKVIRKAIENALKN